MNKRAILKNLKKNYLAKFLNDRKISEKKI